MLAIMCIIRRIRLRSVNHFVILFQMFCVGRFRLELVWFPLVIGIFRSVEFWTHWQARRRELSVERIPCGFCERLGFQDCCRMDSLECLIQPPMCGTTIAVGTTLSVEL